jgi:hypothetical protein
MYISFQLVYDTNWEVLVPLVARQQSQLTVRFSQLISPALGRLLLLSSP